MAVKLSKIIQRTAAALRFLMFKEHNPKHVVVEHLHPIHAVILFSFLYIVPSVVFLYFLPHGLITMLIAEILLVLGVLEALHIMFDR